MDSNSRVGASSSTTRMWSLMGVYFFKPLPETQAERSWETQISRGFFYRLVSECRLAVIRRKRASVISGWIRGAFVFKRFGETGNGGPGCYRITKFCTQLPGFVLPIQNASPTPTSGGLESHFRGSYS